VVDGYYQAGKRKMSLLKAATIIDRQKDNLLLMT
jgi:hypothetical protein